MTTAFPNAQAALGFVQDQTYNVATEVERMEYPAIDINDFLVVNTQGDPWANGVSTYTLDGAGKARWYAGGANTIPLAEIQKGRVDFPFEMGALGYEFNLEEINKARLAGLNISDEKAFYAREGAEQFIYYVGISGDSIRGLTGLVNNTTVSTGYVANDGTGTTRTWSTKTFAQIVRDINNTILAPYNATNQILVADTLLLPYTRMQYLDTQVVPNTNETMLSFIKRANSYTTRTGQELKIRGLRELETAGASSTARMIAYARNARVNKFHMPMPFKFLPVWQNGPMNWLVPGIFRIGGTDWIRPGNATYADGI